VAMAALERKAERAQVTKTSTSQHAAALRGLEAAQQSSGGGGGSQHAAALRGLEAAQAGAKASVSASPSWAVGGGGASSTVVSESPFGMQKAKAALFQKEEREAGAHKGSQMEEAMRRLHGKGVVPTKQAFGTKSKDGTQHSNAIKAFQSNLGAETVSVGYMKKSSLPASGPKPAAKQASDGPTQRQLAMERLQGTLKEE